MKKNKGEILTALTIGSLVILGLASIFSVVFNKEQPIKVKAGTGTGKRIPTPTIDVYTELENSRAQIGKKKPTPTLKNNYTTKEVGCSQVTSISYSPSPVKPGSTFTCNFTTDGASPYTMACGWSINGRWPTGQISGGCNGGNCSIQVRAPDSVSLGALYELVAYDFRTDCGPKKGKRITLNVEGGGNQSSMVPPVGCDPECCGKPEGYVVNLGVKMKCNLFRGTGVPQEGRYVIMDKVCKGGKLVNKAGCTSCRVCRHGDPDIPVSGTDLAVNECTGGCNNQSVGVCAGLSQCPPDITPAIIRNCVDQTGNFTCPKAYPNACQTYGQIWCFAGQGIDVNQISQYGNDTDQEIPIVPRQGNDEAIQRCTSPLCSLIRFISAIFSTSDIIKRAGRENTTEPLQIPTPTLKDNYTELENSRAQASKTIQSNTKPTPTSSPNPKPTSTPTPTITAATKGTINVTFNINYGEYKDIIKHFGLENSIVIKLEKEGKEIQSVSIAGNIEEFIPIDSRTAKRTIAFKDLDRFTGKAGNVKQVNYSLTVKDYYFDFLNTKRTGEKNTIYEERNIKFKVDEALINKTIMLDWRDYFSTVEFRLNLDKNLYVEKNGTTIGYIDFSEAPIDFFYIDQGMNKNTFVLKNKLISVNRPSDNSQKTTVRLFYFLNSKPFEDGKSKTASYKFMWSCTTKNQEVYNLDSEPIQRSLYDGNYHYSYSIPVELRCN